MVILSLLAQCLSVFWSARHHEPLLISIAKSWSNFLSICEHKKDSDSLCGQCRVWNVCLITQTDMLAPTHMSTQSLVCRAYTHLCKQLTVSGLIVELSTFWRAVVNQGPSLLHTFSFLITWKNKITAPCNGEIFLCSRCRQCHSWSLIVAITQAYTRKTNLPLLNCYIITNTDTTSTCAT